MNDQERLLFRVSARKRMYKKARSEGATHKQAKEVAVKVYMWIDRHGNFLPLSDAPRCDRHWAWIK